MSEDQSKDRPSYHHGNLRQVLIDAAVQLVEEDGPANVSVREVAKRAGVSPGAPFRHFSNKTALMTAVAEQAMARFRLEIVSAVEAVITDDPVDRFAAVGVAYLRWAIRNPTHFQIISTRSLIDWENSESLRRDNDAVRLLVEAAMLEARRRNLLQSNDIMETQIAARALVYGLARMYIDGHFAQWAMPGQTAEGTVQTVLKNYISSIRRAPITLPEETI